MVENYNYQADLTTASNIPGKTKSSLPILHLRPNNINDGISNI